METLLSLSRSATITLSHVAICAVIGFGTLFLLAWIAEESEKLKQYRNLLLTLAIVGVFGEQLATLVEFACSEHLQTISDKELAGLNNATEVARRDAAEANRLTEQERHDRVGLQYAIAKILQGRHVSIVNTYAPIARTEFPTVLVQNVEPDPEADRLAGEIAWVLRAPYGWNARRVDEAETHIPNSSIQSGVMIYASDWGPYDLLKVPSTRAENTAQAAKQLVDFFGTQIKVQLVSGKYRPFNLPEGTVLILVGRNDIGSTLLPLLPKEKPQTRYDPSIESGYVDKP